MSDTVMPLQGGGLIAPVTEHQPRRQDGKPPGEGDPQGRQQAKAEPDAERHGHTPPPPPVDDPPVEPATLFSADLVASQMPRTPPSPLELAQRSAGDWSPPESRLHLKDKLI